MDVVCGRCKAEYEFDDALISERGTTVRCTNCGLQFKVFPPVGRRAPEVWRVFNPDVPGGEPAHYESLSQLQKAIAHGEVTAAHKLSRGEEPPRALAEIVELQPLLRQPRSEHPPSLRTEAPAPQGARPSPLPRERSGTVLGIEQRPDPATLAAENHDEEEEVVPGTPEPPESEPAPARTGPSSHPRIRSALSLAPSDDMPPPSSGKEGRASIVPRTSLRSTLSGNYSSLPDENRAPGSTRSSFPASPAVEPLGQAPSSSAPPAADESLSSSESLDGLESPGLPAVEEALAADPPFVEHPPSSEATPSSKPRRGSSEPAINEARESIPGQMTPTPSGLRAYQTVDSVPVSARAGVPAPRRARSVWIVLVVLGGGALFYGVTHQDKIIDLMGKPELSAESGSVPVSDETKAKLEALEVQWVKKEIFGLRDAELNLSALGEQLEALEGEASWTGVNLLRMQGKLEQARQLQSTLAETEQAPLARGLLDYAESPEDPPWPSIQARLKEAALGERSPHIARVVLIYSLASSGQVKRAQAQFESFSRAQGTQQSPLYASLEQMLSSLPEAESEAAAAQGKASLVEPSATPQEEPDQEEEAVPQEAAEQEATDETSTKAPEAAVEKEPASAPRAPKISSETKAKVTQADALWRGGNRDGALALYRQVVAEIGTSHFLGQRSAARIRQAEREKAETK